MISIDQLDTHTIDRLIGVCHQAAMDCSNSAPFSVHNAAHELAAALRLPHPPYDALLLPLWLGGVSVLIQLARVRAVRGKD